MDLSKGITNKEKKREYNRVYEREREKKNVPEL